MGTGGCRNGYDQYNKAVYLSCIFHHSQFLANIGSLSNHMQCKQTQ